MPGCPAAVYSVMKMEPPAMARLKTPPIPPPPPAWVEVRIWTDAVIQDSSPELGEDDLAGIERHLQDRHGGADYLSIHLACLLIPTESTILGARERPGRGEERS